ncbi:MAG: hypothetical protein JST19_09720 [Bacteroidetes bacterium]|nr:hypothetical protein [Bacteroidota bacterium]
MKRTILFITLICGLWNAIFAQQKKIRNKTLASSSATGTKLLLKCNVPVKILVDGTENGLVDAGTLKTLSLPAGKNLISIVPVSEDYRKLDTIVTIKNGIQDILDIRLSQKILTPIDIIQKVITATGLDQFGKTFKTLQFAFEQPTQLSQFVFCFPGNAYIRNTDKELAGSLNESILFNNYWYHRYNYLLYYDSQDNYQTHWLRGPLENFIRRTNKENVIVDEIFLSKFWQNGQGFFDYTTQRISYENMGEEISGNKTLIKIQGSYADPQGNNYTALMYIDKETFFPVKMIINHRSAFKDANHEFQVEISYTDYKFIAPLTLPSKIKTMVIKNDMPFESLCYQSEYSLTGLQMNFDIKNPETLFYAPTNIKTEGSE